MRARPEVLLGLVADSVIAAKFDSQVVENIKVSASQSAEMLEEVLAGLAPDKFPPIATKSVGDAQLCTLLEYVQCLIPVFEGRLLASYASVVTDNIGTTSPDLTEFVVKVGVELMARDTNFAEVIFDHFHSEPPPRLCAQNTFKMLMAFAAHDPKSFFANLAVLVAKQEKISVLPILRLVSFAVEKQLPFLASYSERCLLDFLIETASTNVDSATVSIAIIILSTMLPSTVVAVSQRLSYLHGIVKRVLLWEVKDIIPQDEPSATPYKLQQPLDDMDQWVELIHTSSSSMAMAGRLLFWRIYGLFPHWTLNRLNADWLRVTELDRKYQMALTPMLRCMRLHPLLLRGEDEARNPSQVSKMWAQMSPDEIVSRIERLFAPDRLPGGGFSASTLETVAPSLRIAVNNPTEEPPVHRSRSTSDIADLDGDNVQLNNWIQHDQSEDSRQYADVWTVLDAFEPIEHEEGEGRHKTSALSNLLLHERSMRNRLERRLARALDEAQGTRQLSMVKDSLEVEISQLRNELGQFKDTVETLREERTLLHEEGLAGQRELQKIISTRDAELREAHERISELESQARQKTLPVIAPVSPPSVEVPTEPDHTDLADKLTYDFHSRMQTEIQHLDGRVEKKRADDAQHEVNSLEVLMVELRAQLEEREAEVQVERHLLHGARERITALQKHVDDLEKQVVQQQNAMETLNNAHAAHTSALEERCHELREMMTIMQRKVWEQEDEAEKQKAAMVKRGRKM